MRVHFSSKGWIDYQWWHGDGGAAGLARIHDLIGDAMRHPFTGLGKPEPLKADFKGFWARRITDEHRLIYAVSGIGHTQAIEIVKCRHHYSR